ncbi:MAG: 2-oxo acid dehydrogenase subunit E2 [Nitrospirales bacterium]
MITHVVMPKFTKNKTEGTILSWKMDEGEAVISGDIVAEIETDTAVMELEAFGSGFLRHILIHEGRTVEAETVLAIIGDLDDDIGTTLREQRTLPKIEKVNSKKSTITASLINKSHDPTEELPPTQPARATLTSPSPPSVPHTRKQSEVQRTETPLPDGDLVPHFNLTTEIDMADAERLRAQMIDIQRIPLSFTTLYVRAIALTFARIPKFLTACFGYTEEIIDIGIAVPMEDRILVPIIRNCRRKNIAELSEEIQEITRQTWANQCLSEKDSNARFSMINFGMYPIEQVIPILSSSQIASLAIGAIRSVSIPGQEEGVATVDRRMMVSLSCNEQSLDEEQASQFLQTFKQILERPLEIFLPNPVE